jgi:hypothetical protein
VGKPPGPCSMDARAARVDLLLVSGANNTATCHGIDIELQTTERTRQDKCQVD